MFYNSNNNVQVYTPVILPMYEISVRSVSIAVYSAELLMVDSGTVRNI